MSLNLRPCGGHYLSYGKRNCRKIVVLVNFANLFLSLVHLPPKTIVNKIYVRIHRPRPLSPILFVQPGSWRLLYLLLFWTSRDGDSSVPWRGAVRLPVHWLFRCSLLDSLFWRTRTLLSQKSSLKSF